MRQGTLFDVETTFVGDQNYRLLHEQDLEKKRGYPDPPAVSGAPQTSHDAAKSMRLHASRLALLVLDLIGAHAGMTCQEVEQGLCMRHQTASARIWELRKRGAIKDSGKRRKTSSGRNAIVWVISSTVIEAFDGP